MPVTKHDLLSQVCTRVEEARVLLTMAKLASMRLGLGLLADSIKRREEYVRELKDTLNHYAKALSPVEGDTEVGSGSPTSGPPEPPTANATNDSDKPV